LIRILIMRNVFRVRMHGEGASHKSKVEMAKACTGKPLGRDRLTAATGSELRAELSCRTPPALVLHRRGLA